eukprot:g17142.t1
MHVPARLHPTGTFDPASRGNNLYANSKRANDEFVNGLRDSPRASPNTSRIGDLSSICDAQSPAQRRSSLSTHRALQLSSISEGHVLLSKSELQTSRRKAKELTSRSGQPNGRKGPTTGRSAGRDVVTSKPGDNSPSSTAATGCQGEVDASARRDSEVEVARPRSKSDGQVTGASSSLSRKRSSLTKDCTLATKAKTPTAPGARSGNQHGQPGARDYLQALLHLRTRTTSGDWSEGSSLALHELESILELHDRTMLGGKSSESDEEKGSSPSDDSSKELEDLVSPVGAEEVAGGQGAFPPVAGGGNETPAAATIERGKCGESVENVLGAGQGAAASPGVDDEVAGENDGFFCADSDKTERASHDALQGTDAAVVAESEYGAANVNGSEPGAPESCITQTHKRCVARGSPGASPEDEAEFAPPPRSFDIDTATPSPPRLEIPQPFSASPSDTVCQRADVELVLAAAPSPDSTASPGIWKISAPTDDTDAEDQRSSAEGWSGSCAGNPAMVRQRDELQVLPEEGLRKDSSAARILANIQQICSSNLHLRTPEVKTPPPVPTSSPVFEFARQDLARTRTLATSTGPRSDRAALRSRGAVGSTAGAATTTTGVSKVTGSRLSTTSEKRRASSARGPAIGGSRAKMIAPDGTMQSMLDLAQEITEKIRSFQTLSAQTSRIEADDGGAAAAATSFTNSSVSSASSVCKTVHGRSAAVRAAHLRPPLAAAPSMHKKPPRMLAVLQREMQSDHSTHAGDSELSSAAPSPAELPVPGAAQVAGGAKEAAHEALVLHNPAASLSPGAQVEDVSAEETEYPAASPAAPQLVDAPAPLKSTATIRVFAPTDATSSKASCVDGGAASGASLAAAFRAHTPPTSATCVAAANGLQACASQRVLATAKVNTSSDEKYFQLRQNELGVKQTKNPPGLTGNKKWETDRWALADYDANSAALNELLASEGLPDEDFELGLMAEVGSTATDVVKFSPSTSFEHLLLRKKLGVHFAEHPASAAGTRKEQARGTLFQPSPMSGYSADSERAMSGINSPSPVDI